MGFKCGIVGLPNVGKSTLFCAITATASAECANYPFCTIEPNSGVVSVPDGRLDTLAAIAKSKEIIPTRLEFVDIAGLVKGASKGEGLGNQFLANIREVDAIIHVVRCFDDAEVAHVEGAVDPVRDIGIIDTELMLADMESLQKRLAGFEKKARGGDKESTAFLAAARASLLELERGEPARVARPDAKDAERLRAFDMLQLLTAKPVLYACNVDEEAAAPGNQYSRLVEEHAAKAGSSAVFISAKIEREIAILENAAEKAEFLGAMGLAETGLAKIVRAGYGMLGLITFFTAGPKEARAWTIRRGARAPEAAGAIHTDFEKGFIRAEAVSFEDYVLHGGEQGAREAGRLRTEGRDYTVQDGDVMRFLFNT